VAASAGERDGGLRLPRVAMKTGTSFGLHDAWAMASSPRWTIGVWLGNFDAAPSPALVGATAALPVALALFRRLEPSGDGPWLAPPAAARRDAGPPSGAPAVLDWRSSVPGGVIWTSPPDGATYFPHRREGGGELRLRAELLEPGRASSLSWFVDGEFAGRSRSGETLAWPLRAGEHRVTLVTPAGRAMVRTITARDAPSGP
jgi:penicillin-binding protein 1C